jgi:anti-sigma factor RsiW
MAPEPQRLTTADRSNLVAYLDGELPEAEARQIATRLAGSISGRREAEAFQRTWDLLDHLPRPQPSAEFASRTLTLATAEAAPEDRLARLVGPAVRRAAQGTALGLAALAVGLIAYAAVRWAWPDPTARLARDLTIAENLDAYLEVGTMEFLQQLDDSPEFAGPSHRDTGEGRP